MAAVGMGVGMVTGMAGSIIDMINSGSKPVVPTIPKLNLGAEQQKAITANTAALPAAEKLVGKANLFSRDQITQMLNATVPGFANMSASATANIESMLKGEIPSDVSAAVQNSAAARSLGSGFAGSGMGRNLLARDLGLTSLDMTQKGLSSAESWIGKMASIYQPNMLNVGSMFISPMQMYETDNQQNLQQAQQQWLANQISAMPDPGLTAIAKGLKEIGSDLMGGMSGMPGLGGGGGGGGGSSTGKEWDYGGELNI